MKFAHIVLGLALLLTRATPLLAQDSLTLQRQLTGAAALGDVSEVKQYEARGANINDPFILAAAAGSGAMKVAEYLIGRVST